MKCPKCNVDMKMGFAIEEIEHVGRSPCFQAPIYNKTPKIINCLKCPKCGHSDDMK